jgi:TonB family protein
MPRLAFVILQLAAFASLGPVLLAQQILVVEHEGKPRPVITAIERTPYVEVEGRRVATSPVRLALVPGREFLPVLVTVKNMKVGTRGIELMDTGGRVNNELTFRAEFESQYPLDDTFLVLDMDMESGGKMFFIQGIGRLVPRESKSVAAVVPLAFPLGEGKFQFHVFSGGVETFHSQMPFEFRQQKLDRMVADRVAKLTDAMPRPFVGPIPEYPESLKKKKTSGQAVVSMRVTPRGRVLDPVITSATDPAFAESALAAIRIWRFLPRVINGRPVETKVDMPFVFGPPPAPPVKQSP